MRWLLTFLFIIILPTTALSKVVSSGERTVTKEVLSFTVSPNPEVVTARVVERYKTKKIESSPRPVPLAERSSRELKVALSFLATFLAVVGMWSSLKTMLITIANLGRAGFGLKTIAGVIVFVMSLAMLFYALNLMMGSL